jgi:hypothetical protein
VAQTYEFFAERAKEASKEAEQATLDNVRDRALRSAAAWRDMADRALRIQEDREAAKRDRERAAVRVDTLEH